MSRIFRVGVIGFAHMHVNTLISNFDGIDGVKWVACADTKPPVESISRQNSTRGANISRTLENISTIKFYEDYEEMLEKEVFDIMIVCCENSLHAPVIEKCAEKKINVITEKPMADSMSGALRIYRAVEHSGIKFAVNWPTTWSPVIRKAHELCTGGEIGRIWEFKYRNGASLGPFSYGQSLSDDEKNREWWYRLESGGGAFLDYCCYGACLSRWFLGSNATAVTAMKANMLSHFGNTEDNGIICARFKDSMAIIEGTWSTYHIGIPNGPIVYGSEGTLVTEGNRVLVYKERGGEKPSFIYDPEPLAPDRNNPAKEFIHHILTGEPLHPTMDMEVNLDAMGILDGGIRSANSGKMELVNDAFWSIG